jgi:hypothetical protein
MRAGMRIAAVVILSAAGVFWAVRDVWAYAGVCWAIGAASGLSYWRWP